MVHFQVRIDTPRPPEEAWNRVLDLRLHDRLIPLTRITSGMVPAAGLLPGSEFVARTGVGPLGFDDRMVVTDVTPPVVESAGFARIRKVGGVVQGSIELRVTARPPVGSRVVWDQEISVWGVPRALGWLTARVSRAAYGLALRRLLAHD
jgi:hypothetical protein